MNEPGQLNWPGFERADGKRANGQPSNGAPEAQSALPASSPICQIIEIVAPSSTLFRFPSSRRALPPQRRARGNALAPICSVIQLQADLTCLPFRFLYSFSLIRKIESGNETFIFDYTKKKSFLPKRRQKKRTRYASYQGAYLCLSNRINHQISLLGIT